MSLLKTYSAEVLPALKKALKSENVLSLPKLSKIVINVGMGSWLQGGKDFAPVVFGVEAISGQKAVVKRSKKSISNFKLRSGQAVGVMVTLRGEKMYDFLERFIAISAPRIRDFVGFPVKSFDGRGNYSFGVSEYTVFPEVHFDDVVKNFGFQITISTTAKNDEEAKMLLDAFRFPFKK
jgi:large subunit ribosomal protein L5